MSLYGTKFINEYHSFRDGENSRDSHTRISHFFRSAVDMRSIYREKDFYIHFGVCCATERKNSGFSVSDYYLLIKFLLGYIRRH